MKLPFNPEQLDAVNCRAGAWLWLATAGSGKTAVLTERVMRLLQENQPLNEILALTFTAEAADNMLERLGIKMSKSERYGFKTFHSFGLKVVFAEKDSLPFRLADNPFESLNGTKVIRELLRSNGRKVGKKEMQEVQGAFSRMKRGAVKLPVEFCKDTSLRDHREWGFLYPEYVRRMRAGGWLDFDDMLVEAVNLLEKPGIRARWQYKWVLCDEGQDTDNLQFRMLQLISEKHGNVFVVADVNQCMYGFRGAKPENVEKFEAWFPGAQIRILPENYRSTPEIVKFGQKIAPIKNQLVANMRTSNPSGVPIVIMPYTSTSEEVNAVLQEVAKDPGQSAVLARTNQQIGFFETECTLRGIKFHLLGRSGFWKTSEIRNVLALAKFLSGTDEPDSYPQRLVHPLRARIQTMEPGAALDEIILAAKLHELYSNDEYEEEANFAIGNLDTIVQIAYRFETLSEFMEFANRASHASRKSKNAVTLGTIHAAKGLEWDNVFVVGAQEGKLPHEKAADMQEEERILYVSVSRPRKRLQISYVGAISRFLEEVEGQNEASENKVVL